MSEKRYIIVSPSHHKKQRAMFLSAPTNGTKYVWEQGIKKALLFTLSQARNFAKESPIGVYFVEHTKAMQSVYGEAEQDKTYFDDFTGYANDFGYEFICDWRQSENANLSGEPQETPEEKREYVVYCYKDRERRFFNSHNEKMPQMTINGQTAILFTRDAAADMSDIFTQNSEQSWFFAKVPDLLSETPAPEAKKRVGYVLYHSTQRQERIYAHYESNGVFVRVAGIVADAYRTPEDAKFAADVLNNNGDANFNWQVEQIEF